MSQVISLKSAPVGIQQSTRFNMMNQDDENSHVCCSACNDEFGEDEVCTNVDCDKFGECDEEIIYH